MKVDLDWINANTKVQTATTRYVITKYRTEPGIWCRACEMLSFNQGDVANKYCGHCDVFHDEPSSMQARAIVGDAHVSLYLPPAASKKMSELTVNGESFLVESDGTLTYVHDLNGSLLFDLPSSSRLEYVVACAKAYMAGRNRERVRQEIERRG